MHCVGRVCGLQPGLLTMNETFGLIACGAFAVAAYAYLLRLAGLLYISHPHGWASEEEASRIHDETMRGIRFCSKTVDAGAIVGVVALIAACF